MKIKTILGFKKTQEKAFQLFWSNCEAVLWFPHLSSNLNQIFFQLATFHLLTLAT